MRKQAATLDSGLEIRQPATAPSTHWPETGGTLANWRYSRSAHRVKHLTSARLRNGAPRDVMDAAEDLLI